MQQKELEQAIRKGTAKNVMAVNNGDHFNVCLDDGGVFVVIRTARGGKREFKTLDAVRNMLSEIGVKSFSVC